MQKNIIIKPFNQLTVDELYLIFDLRNRVFVTEQKILYADTDFKDQHAIHYFIKEQNRVICYLRLIHPGIKYKEHAISRVVTHPDYRKQGLAAELIIKAIEDLNGSPVRISGQAYLKDYYLKLGFQVVKGPYIEEDILHYEMLHQGITKT
ncbi:MAG: GNAT family N-acetyltransferase [Acholeplasmataceae bacterium]